MAEQGLRQFNVAPGFLATEESPNADRFYMTVEQFRELYCMDVTEAQIRFAMDLIHATVNRPSLWPEVYEEALEVPEDRNQVILAARPILRLVSASGRYGYGRRDRRSANIAAYDAMAITALFGSPPGWCDIDPNTIEWNGASGAAWLPAGFFLANYSDVQIKYVSGLLQPSSRLKAAMVEIVNTVREKGVSDRTTYWVGRVQRGHQAPGFVTDVARSLLEPYVVRALF